MSPVEDDLAPDHAAAAEWLRELQARMDLSMLEIREVLERVLPLASSQARALPEVRRRLLETLMADLDVLDPVPHASVWQAQRVAETRNRLLAAGAWTVAALAEARGSTASTARTWLARQRAADRLVSVNVRGDSYVPGILLDEAAEPHPGIDAVLRPLRQAGMDPWAVWVWLDTPSSWLDGERPATLIARRRVGRVAAAATSQAAGAAGAARESHVA